MGYGSRQLQGRAATASVQLMSPNREHQETPKKSSRVRLRVLAFLCVLSFLTYYDRQCIVRAQEGIQQSLGVTDAQLGIIFGSFWLAYALFEIPGGWMGDLFGAVHHHSNRVGLVVVHRLNWGGDGLLLAPHLPVSVRCRRSRRVPEHGPHSIALVSPIGTRSGRRLIVANRPLRRSIRAGHIRNDDACD